MPEICTVVDLSSMPISTAHTAASTCILLRGRTTKHLWLPGVEVRVKVDDLCGTIDGID